MIDPEDAQKKHAVGLAAALIRDVGLNRLCDFEHCCCSQFSIRGFEIEISCGGGAQRGVWISGHACSRFMEDGPPGETWLRPIMDEIIKQLEETHGDEFAQFFHPQPNGNSQPAPK